jgi:hypothetical protein
MPGFRAGRAPRNKGLRYPADPPRVEEIVAVMRAAGDGAHGRRLRGLIVILNGTQETLLFAHRSSSADSRQPLRYSSAAGERVVGSRPPSARRATNLPSVRDNRVVESASRSRSPDRDRRAHSCDPR